jgi:hypothetical protein
MPIIRDNPECRKCGRTLEDADLEAGICFRCILDAQEEDYIDEEGWDCPKEEDD